MSKRSVRFFNDREVRAVWDEAQNTWRFAVLDIIGVFNEESDYTKTRNYWKYLKAKLKNEGKQLVSATTQLKLTAPDGKKYLTDTMDSEGVIALAKQFPNTKATKFLDWFVYSDSTIDGQSKKKAYTFWIWLDLIFRRSLKKCVDWSQINKADYLNAMKISPVDSGAVKQLLQNALTTRVGDREIFMKGIDYSYYYEQEEGWARK